MMTMLKNYSIFAVFISLLATSSLNAQTMASAANVPPTTSAYKPGRIQETPEQARNQIIAHLNLLRGFSVSVDAISMGAANGKDQALLTPDAEENLPQNTNFDDYIKKMTKLIQKKLNRLERDTMSANAKAVEKSKLLRGLNILTGASCLVNKNTGNFVRMYDADGFDIIAFPVDTLRANARYGVVDNYKEGFARVQKDQVYGYYSYCGDEVIPCQYESAQAFNDGRALVKKAEWYFIDAIGNESSALDNIEDAKAIIHGISLVKLKSGKYTFINNRYDETKLFLTAQYDEIKPFYRKDIFLVRNGTKTGLINLAGAVKLDVQYDRIEPSNVENVFKIYQGEKIGIVDTLWKVRFQPSFASISDFNQFGLAIAKEGEGYRLINHRNFRSSANYAAIGEFASNGMASIKNLTQHYGLMDTTLKIVVPPSYFSLGNFNKFGLAPACHSDKKCGFINLVGKEVILPIYEELGDFTNSGLVVVRELTKDCNKNKNCKSDMVYDSTGRVIIGKATGVEGTMKIHYEIIDTALHSGKYIAVKTFVDEKESGFHLIDANNYRQLTATPYEIISAFDANGLFRIRKGGLWGLMDTSGKVITKIAYKDIKKQTEGFYAVLNDNDEFGFMDKKGKIQIPFEYTEIKAFRNGYAMVSKGKEKWGLINKFNAKIVPCVFKDVKVTEKRYELTDGDGKTYIVNDKGDCEQNCTKFEEIRRKANHSK
jgi:hypothetical protein